MRFFNMEDAPDSASYDGEVTPEMLARAKSWCAEFAIHHVNAAPALAEVFACWAAEYFRRGKQHFVHLPCAGCGGGGGHGCVECGRP